MKVKARTICDALTLACSLFVLLSSAVGQSNSYERTFPQSKAEVEKALTALQPSLAGHLPVLDGFAKPGEHPFDRYERGYYQSTAKVTAASSGGCVVRITTKVTAWYDDPLAGHSGYQLLTSNGRIESDLLDQLADQLGAGQLGADRSEKETTNSPAPTEATTTAPKVSPQPLQPTAPADATVSTSPSQLPAGTFAPHVNSNLTDEMRASARNAAAPAPKTDSALQAEANNLEELLHNVAHPKNLVAVKKSGTPVVGKPSLTAKPEFLASMHDEFELLDFNADWVHVRISGLSRGWIWRNSVEMPEGIGDNDVRSGATQTAAADLFHVTHEEASTFPGDWEPLKNKNVKIISVQKVDENARQAEPQERLEYAKFLMEKGYAEIAQQTQGLAGIVVIFDSADGGMIAATMPALQQWKAGKLSDSALWHQSFLDPPETFDSTAPSGSQ